MPIRQALPPILRGEEARDLGPDTRARLETLADEARTEGAAAFLRDECAARLRQPGATPGVEYLLAAACAQNGEVERAHQTLLSLGERLAAARQWEPLATVAERALALEATHAAARLLVAAHEGLGQDPARIEALEQAWVLLSDDLDFGLLLAVRLGEAGESERRRQLLIELLPRFAAEKRYAGLEEAALEFVEHGGLEGLAALIETLPTVAEQGAIRECAQLIEIAFPELAKAGRAGECLAALRAVAQRAVAQLGSTGAEPFRAAVIEALRQGAGRELPDPAPVFRISGLDDPMKPLVPALERFDAIAALPPGRAVHHASFGAGRIVSNDGDAVAIDFAKSRGHRMPYAAARRSLGPIAEDDLRLLVGSRPEELVRLRAEEPAEIIWRALRSLGGSGDAQKLKVFLVGSNLVPSTEWTTFWRRARAAAEKDPRIDASRAFEQQYSLARATAAAVEADSTPLPALEPRKPVKSNLGTLRKFLQQHPQAEAPLARRFGKYVERAVLDAEADPVDRARAGLYFSRWSPDRAAEWREVLKLLWEQGLSISDLASEDEQLGLLEASHAAGVEADAILSGLDSRFAAVRSAAERYRERLDDRGRGELTRTLLRHASRYPGAAIRVIETELGRELSPDEGWRAFRAALALIEERPKPSVAEKVLRWLEPHGPFDRRLAGAPCPEEIRLHLRVSLRQWRSSDRFLFPALEAAERLGLGEEAETVRSERQRSTARLFDGVGQQAENSDLPVMTRATWERLRGELERMERELRTTIPAAIQKARELGDLRENAEFHSAKLKQANVSRLVASLQSRLGRARFVDDVEHQDGTVGLGTEVVLESEEELTTFWILGEGEHHHGEHVVSFQAPVGRALLGRAIGDEVELGEGSERRRYRVVSVERKLPPHEPTS
jgi:transcription elongation factor GreA